MRLAGKTALVTGSGKGIGRAIAVRLAREGADVVIHYNRTADGAEEALAEVNAAGRRGHIVQADLTRVDDVRRLVQASIEKLGRLDVLVNNAGMGHAARFWEVTEKDYDFVLNLNLKAAFFGSQEFTKHLLDTKRPGKIINISSVHEDVAFPGYASYCASKGGLRMLTRNLAVELGPHGITVNGIAPGAIGTERNLEALKGERLELLVKQIPLGRLGEPDEIGGLAAFLASSDADYITGATYYIDGGLAVHYEE